jgi:hypothetical protein
MELIRRWVENTLKVIVVQVRGAKPAPNVWIRVNN